MLKRKSSYLMQRSHTRLLPSLPLVVTSVEIEVASCAAPTSITTTALLEGESEEGR